MKHHLSQKQDIHSRLDMKERNADRTSSRSILFLAFLFTAVAATAQDACYLLGNDSDTPQANHASATLTKVSDGVFQGEVNFNSKGFYVATKLASTADDWESIDNDVWCGNYKYGRKLTIGESYTMQRGHSTRNSVPFRIQGGTYKVTVDFNQETILAEESSTPDPGSDPDPDPEPENYINEESTGGCYLFCFTGKNEKGWSEYTFTQPSATLAKTNTEGVYAGNVQLTSSAFTITRALTSMEVNLDENAAKYSAAMRALRPYRYNPTEGVISVNKTVDMVAGQSAPVDFWMPDYNPSHTYWVSVNFNTNSMAVCMSKDEDPFVEIPDVEPTEPNDIDLTSGAHFTVNLTQPGSLKQRLENAVFQTDYDLVDFLTVRGKLGGADLAYLQAQEGLVSQLQYLDISQVELVYDDEPYFQNGHGGFYSTHTNIFTLSAENYDEQGDGGMQGQVSVTSTICHRNDLSHAFENMEHLKECYLPKTLTAIGENMFSGTPIAKVGMPSAPTYIGNYAFENKNLWYEAPGTLGQIDIPSSVKSIGINAFIGQPIKSIDVSHVTSFGEGCLSSTYIQSIQLNDQVEMIPGTMFSGCTKLAAIDIPANVVEIGNGAFNGCEKLATVTMGDKVKKIGGAAFSGCTSLEDMTISPNIEEIGRDAFASVYYYGTVMSDIPWVAKLPNEGGVLYISKVAYKHLDGTDLNIKEGTVSLADGFVNAKGLNSITLPSTLRILGKECFKNAALSSIDLPESLEKIGEGAFAAVDGGSSKLRRITIPKNVKIIESGAFYGTPLVRVYYNAADANYKDVEHTDGSMGYERIFPESLARVIIGEGVKSIPDGLFDGCKNIARVEMSSTVERIGDYAFNGCSSLSHIDLPSSLKEIGKNAFNGCALQSVTSYMKEPFVLGEASVQEGETQKLGWKDENGNITWYQSTGHNTVWDPNAGYEWLPYYYVSASCDTPFGNVDYSYERGNTEEEAANKKAAVPLLKVPNGTLDAYLADLSWAVTFYTIEQFDGASSTEAVEETTTVSVSETVSDETDLTSTLIGNVFVTLDTEGSGDGYDAAEGCLVINSTVNDEQLAAATADGADDLTVKNQFNGLIFEVPASKGRIVIDCQTLGQNALYVKIGQSEPQKVESAGRSQATVPYNVGAPTHIYVYAAPKATSASREEADQPLHAPRRTAYANDDAVKVYGLSINVDDTSDIDTPRPATDSTAPWYTIDGRRMDGQPTQKGVYIHGSRKVLVK